MSMPLDGWVILALLARALLYAGFVSAAGSVLVWALSGRPAHSHRLPFDGLLAGAVAVGLLSAVWYFLLRVGAVSQQGPAGMGDWQMGRIMADTALGDGSALRIAGFLVLAMALPVMVLCRNRPGRGWGVALGIVAGAGLLLLAGSFAAFGHARELAWSGRIAVVAHVTAIALWTGSLWPLWRCCHVLPPQALGQLMRRFGDLARWLLVVMLISGGVLAWQLTGSLDGLAGTTYGRVLLAKLLLVAGLAGMGAWHRYRRVPALERATDPAARRQAVQALRRSILAEAGLAAAVIITTVLLTGLFSPPV